MTSPQLSPLDALLARLRAADEDARRVMAEKYPDLPQAAPRAPIAPLSERELPPWTAVELELDVSDDIVTFVGRDLITGRPRIKVQMARADASPEWVSWIRRWLVRHRRGTLRLVD